MSTQSARFLLLLGFAIGLCPYGAWAQDLSASDILKRVAESYGRVSNFSIVAEKKVDFDTDTLGERYLHLNPNEVQGGSHRSDDIDVTLVASSWSKARLLLKDGKKEVVVVSDGKVVWTLIPAQNAYTELPARILDIERSFESNDVSGIDLLGNYENLLAARFRSLSIYKHWAIQVRSERLKVGKERKECYLLTMHRSKGSQKHKFWVDKNNFTIWKSVDTSLSPTIHAGEILQTTVTVTMKQMALNPSLDESNFVFTPPDHAKKVDLLRLSGNNPFW